MIIQIRGTSGSGKSTLVRGLLEQLTNVQSIHVSGRRQPLGYTGCVNTRRVTVLGHYATPCGGCDTISDRDYMFKCLREYSADGDVLAEGVVLSDEVLRTVALALSRPTTVLHLTTPLAVCLESVLARRQQNPRSAARPFNPANTAKRIPAIQRACDRLAQAGVPVIEVTRDSAAVRLREMLGVPL